ncbi:unnamed protein product [Cuscuta epithymum]|uniref:Uncharacterized protein n=1 Tax=Cuscuta epithymum TaxID=186058 RepID=A0AAV0CES2_9ASTE|nr:unnamed protein product [Cuscuta epithymum]
MESFSQVSLAKSKSNIDEIPSFVSEMRIEALSITLNRKNLLSMTNSSVTMGTDRKSPPPTSHLETQLSYHVGVGDSKTAASKARVDYELQSKKPEIPRNFFQQILPHV